MLDCGGKNAPLRSSDCCIISLLLQNISPHYVCLKKHLRSAQAVCTTETPYTLWLTHGFRLVKFVAATSTSCFFKRFLLKFRPTLIPPPPAATSMPWSSSSRRSALQAAGPPAASPRGSAACSMSARLSQAPPCGAPPPHGHRRSELASKVRACVQTSQPRRPSVRRGVGPVPRLTIAAERSLPLSASASAILRAAARIPASPGASSSCGACGSSDAAAARASIPAGHQTGRNALARAHQPRSRIRGPSSVRGAARAAGAPSGSIRRSAPRCAGLQSCLKASPPDSASSPDVTRSTSVIGPRYSSRSGSDDPLAMRSTFDASSATAMRTSPVYERPERERRGGRDASLRSKHTERWLSTAEGCAVAIRCGACSTQWSAAHRRLFCAVRFQRTSPAKPRQHKRRPQTRVGRHGLGAPTCARKAARP